MGDKLLDMLVESKLWKSSFFWGVIAPPFALIFFAIGADAVRGQIGHSTYHFALLVFEVWAGFVLAIYLCNTVASWVAKRKSLR